MPLKTHLNIDVPARERLRQEITLISRGMANPKAFPGGLVVVYPWDVQTDDWMISRGRNPDSSVFDLIPRLCNLNGAKVNELFVGDASTILLVSRSLRHGGQIEFSPVCPNCHKTNKQIAMKVPDGLRRVGEKPVDWPGTDKFTLPSSKDEVEIRPMRVGDERRIDAMTSEEVTLTPPLVARIVQTIVSVGGGAPDSKPEVVKWFNILDPVDQDFLSDSIDRLHPRLDGDINFVCDICGKPFIYTINFDKNFFRSRVV